jgi:hypothetical protein
LAASIVIGAAVGAGLSLGVSVGGPVLVGGRLAIIAADVVYASVAGSSGGLIGGAI